MKIIAIDPGPEKSAFVQLEDGRVTLSAELENWEMLCGLEEMAQADILAIEMVACYGMPVGAEVFNTCRWIGRFEQVWIKPARLVFRKEVKLFLCGSLQAKDPNIRQALIDKYGPPGTKKAQGRLYGITGHLWAAMAVADYVWETRNAK